MQNGPFAFLSVGGVLQHSAIFNGDNGDNDFCHGCTIFSCVTCGSKERESGIVHQKMSSTRKMGNLLRLKCADALSALGWYDKTEA